MTILVRLSALALGAALLTGCETTDVNRAALGGLSGALIAEATGGDPVDGAALGVAGGIVCDDLTPQLCPN